MIHSSVLTPVHSRPCSPARSAKFEISIQIPCSICFIRRLDMASSFFAGCHFLEIRFETYFPPVWKKNLVSTSLKKKKKSAQPKPYSFTIGPIDILLDVKILTSNCILVQQRRRPAAGDAQARLCAGNTRDCQGAQTAGGTFLGVQPL